MTDSETTILLDGDRRDYHPGDTLSGRVRFDDRAREGVKSVTISVGWSTEGKGDEDRGDPWTQTFSPDDAAAGAELPFSVVLPASPLSYDGVLVKVCWWVRLDVTFPRGRPQTQTLPIRLGDVAPATWLTRDSS